MGSSHRKQRLVARTTIDAAGKTPAALCRLVNQDNGYRARRIAREPLLQAGQARQGANEYLFYAVLASEPFAPVGRADRGDACEHLGSKQTLEFT